MVASFVVGGRWPVVSLPLLLRNWPRLFGGLLLRLLLLRLLLLRRWSLLDLRTRRSLSNGRRRRWWWLRSVLALRWSNHPNRLWSDIEIEIILRSHEIR
jgi:hypothetical protein